MEAEVVVMSTGMMFMIGVAVFLFRKVIFATADLAEETVGRCLNVSSDTLETYEQVVAIANAKKREELFNEIEEMTHIVTSKDLKELLAGKAKRKPASKKPQEA